MRALGELTKHFWRCCATLRRLLALPARAWRDRRQYKKYDKVTQQRQEGFVSSAYWARRVPVVQCKARRWRAARDWARHRMRADATCLGGSRPGGGGKTACQRVAQLDFMGWPVWSVRFSDYFGRDWFGFPFQICL